MTDHATANLALSNRFRVIHGAQDDFEVNVCTGMVPLACALICSAEEEYRIRISVALLHYLTLILHSHNTPPERVRELRTAVEVETNRELTRLVDSVKALGAAS